MTSIDQAFIKAFARRSRPSRDVSAANTTLESPTDIDGLQVDPSVDQTAKIWIDTAEDRTLRADQGADNAVPAPHHPAVIAPINPAEHFRCDYVFGDVKEIADADPAVDDETAEVEMPAEPDVTPVATEPVVTEPVVTDPEPETPVADPSTAEETVAESVTIKPLEPVWEVDSFDVPANAANLFFEESLFETVANRMRDAVDEGLKSLVVTSAHAGEGRSTVSMGIALAAAATGLRVALVDGDTEEPTLADDLRLDLDYGWVDTIRGGLPIDQVAVHSVRDGVTLIPLVPPTSSSPGAAVGEVEQLVSELQNRFDLIVVDGPSCAMPRIQQFASLVDTAIIARDASRTDADTINELSYRLRESGVQGVGIVENFG